MEAECPKLVAWAKRCMERETVSKTLLDEKKVYAHVVGKKKALESK